jgi:hypothetical protein
MASLCSNESTECSGVSDVLTTRQKGNNKLLFQPTAVSEVASAMHTCVHTLVILTAQEASAIARVRLVCVYVKTHRYMHITESS